MKTLRLLVGGVLLFVLSSHAVAGRFVGELVFIPAGCEKTLECTLKNDFGFVDSQGIGWQAAAGLKTDGASIPDWAQPFIGDPFAKEFVKAAVIHDHYCRRHVRPWQQTHEVLYEALLEGGVDNGKALLMYYAVYLRGPKWVELIKGKPCPVGKTCVKAVGSGRLPAGVRLSQGEDGRSYGFRKAEYDNPDFARQLRETEKFIADRKGQATLREMRERAHRERPGDLFYSGVEALVVQPSSGETK